MTSNPSSPAGHRTSRTGSTRCKGAEGHANSRDMPLITCIEDLRRLHRKRAPKAFYDYVDAGSYSESTYRANSADLAALRLRQRVGLDVDVRSTESTVLGRR